METLNIKKLLTRPTTLPEDETGKRALYLLKESEDRLNVGIMNQAGNRAACLLRDVALSGAETLYQSSEGVAVQSNYVIENYDSFTTYSVSISAGSVSITGDTITVTTPTTPGDIYLNVNGEFSLIVVKPPAVLPATITYPEAGMEFTTSLTAVGTAFATSGTSDTCTSSEWRLSTDASFETGVVSAIDTGDVTAHLFEGLTPGTTYYLQFRHVGTALGAGEWSDTVVFKTRLAALSLAETAMIEPISPVVDEAFGFQVALAQDGQRAFVSALHGSGSGENIGYVREYANIDNTWTLSATIEVAGAVLSEAYGAVMAVSEDGLTLALGSKHNATNGTDAGCVKVFSKNSGAWLLAATLTPDSPAAGQLFGSSLAINAGGTCLFIGSEGANSGAGAVMIFELTNDVWDQVLQLSPTVLTPTLSFGASIALTPDGTVAAIGDPSEPTTLADVGCVYIYRRGITEWALDAKVYPDDELTEVDLTGSAFGTAVAISADGSEVWLASLAYSSAGGVALFEQIDETWVNTGLLAIEAALPGYVSGVAINHAGTRALLPVRDSNFDGQLAVFDKTNGVWAQTALIQPTAPYDGATFADTFALSTSGKLVIGGEPGSDSQIDDGGSVYVFS